MNSHTDQRGDPVAGPPFDPELVADLHAGVLDPPYAERLHAAMLADAQASHLLEQLDAVTAGLAEPDDADGRDEPIPELVSARIRRSLAAEPGHSGTDVGHRRRKTLITAASIAAGLAILIPVGRAVTAGHDSPPHAAATAFPQADPNSADFTNTLTASQIRHARGADDPGPYSDPARLARCLEANGLPPDAGLLGAGPVHVDGTPGTLLLVPGPHPPQLTGLVVTDTCGQDGPGLLLRTEVGG